MTYSPNFRGNSSAAPSKSVATGLLNNTGNTLTKATPVYVNSSGDMAAIDVSSEASALSIVGVVVDDINHSNRGEIAYSGRIEDVSVLGSFGDSIYISKLGTLTNVKPSQGVGGFDIGDWIIRAGVLAKNENNPALKDLILNVAPLGQI